MRDHEQTLARLRKLSEQLDAAKQAVESTTKDITRARPTTEKTRASARKRKRTTRR